MEVEKAVDVKILRLLCATDGVEMELLNVVNLTQPPLYNYQCPVCKHKEVARNQYPLVVYKEKK